MAKTIPEKNIDINGEVVGANSTIKLSVKTAIWIIGVVVGLVMSILTYAYFDLKKDIKASQENFVKNVDENVESMRNDIQDIRVDVATVKGDIKLILDRQTRDNPIKSNPNVSVESITPPE